MTLPNLLGIGPQRSGSTWLYQQLNSHPDIYMSNRKEVNFFDKNYNKGIEWYEGFFSDPTVKDYKIIGEVSPAYLYSKDVPELIYKYLPQTKFISILRNPVTRAVSQYKYAVRNNNDPRTLLQYLHETDVVDRGFYSRQISRYYKFFPRNNFLFLIFEETLNNPLKGLSEIGYFLDVDPNKFDFNLASKKVNSSKKFRFSVFFRLVRTFLKKQRVSGNLYNDSFMNFLKDVYLRLPEDLFQIKDADTTPIDSESYQFLVSQYHSEILELEKLLNMDFIVWKDLKL